MFFDKNHLVVSFFLFTFARQIKYIYVSLSRRACEKLKYNKKQIDNDKEICRA